MDRRSFLFLAGGALAYPLFRFMQTSARGSGLPSEFELVSGYGRWVDSAIDQIDPSLPSRLVIFNPGSGAMHDFPVPFRIHMAVQNPRRPEQLILISKWGTEIASFNRTSGSVEGTASSAKGRRFFGHAVWDPKEDGFWISEQDDLDFRGRIVLRGHDLAIRREMESHGLYPHDVQMPEPGVLAVANNGDFYGIEESDFNPPRELRVSNVTWIDTRSGRVLRQVRFPELLGRAGASHFQSLPERAALVGGKTRGDDDASVVIRVAQDGSYRFLKPTAGSESYYQGEAISFALDGDRIVWTHSKEKAVFSAALDGDQAHLLTPTRSRGIAAWDDELIVSHAKKPILLKIKGKDVVAEIDGPSLDGHRWGSHLSRIKGA